MGNRPRLIRAQWRADARGNLVEGREELEEFFGGTYEYGTNNHIAPEDRDRVGRERRRAIEAGIPFRCRYVGLFGDGRRRIVSSRALPVYTLDGDPAGFVGSVRLLAAYQSEGPSSPDRVAHVPGLVVYCDEVPC